MVCFGSALRTLQGLSVLLLITSERGQSRDLLEPCLDDAQDSGIGTQMFVNGMLIHLVTITC